MNLTVSLQLNRRKRSKQRRFDTAWWLSHGSVYPHRMVTPDRRTLGALPWANSFVSLFSFWSVLNGYGLAGFITRTPKTPPAHVSGEACTFSVIFPLLSVSSGLSG